MALEKEILEFAEKKNLLIHKKALELLVKKDNWKQIIFELEKKNNFMITESLIQKELEKERVKVLEEIKNEHESIDTPKAMPHTDLMNTEIQPEAVIQEQVFRPIAEETQSNYNILSDLDITGKSDSQGKVEDFQRMFTDKFDVLSKLLKQKQFIHARPIKEIKKITPKTEIDLIGMVAKKWITKKGDLAITIEDTEGEVIVLINDWEKELKEEANKLMLDDVIAFKTVKWSDDLVIGKKLFWPDLKVKPLKTVDTEVSVACTSDIHIGSKLFLEKEFEKLINFLCCKEGDMKEKNTAGRIKYLFLLGDNVDGIGVYPKQEKDLDIKDLYEQYRELEKYLLRIPEYIEIFMIPGQHDATRNLDPRPAVQSKYMPELSKMKNFHSLGSPSVVEVEGLNTLLFHGNTMHSLFENIHGLNGLKPSKATVEMLKRRDLMTTFGLNQSMAPEKKNLMLVRKETDLVFFGDIHRFDYIEYRGTTIINNSTWQARTDYQIKKGHIPTPGMLAMIDLNNRKLKTKNFYESDAK